MSKVTNGALTATALMRPRRGGIGRASERRTAWAMMLPAGVLLLVFLIIPILLTFGLAFTNTRLISPNPPSFSGLENFVRALSADPALLASARNTLYFAAVVVPVQGGLGLALALLVNQRIRGVNFFRTVFFLPVVTSMVVVAMLWKFMYQPDGLINAILGLDDYAWLGESATAMPSIMAMSIWQGVGFHMVIFLAGLQTIPAELYEAAELDGASRRQQFRHVTVPGLRPTFVFVLITITIAAFSLFVQVDVMTSGGPLDSTTSMVYHAVTKGYRQKEMGYGAAIALIYFLMVLAVALVQRRLTREER
jgi:multiple sugar transport system permease protein/raffinose/stachyose/melibiose transport system permease protein